MIRLDDSVRQTSLTKSRYDADDVRSLRRFLGERGTFEFPVLSSGLFSAARLSAGAEYTGYGNVWVRDNVHIAHAQFACGRFETARGSVLALTRYFGKHRRRFEAIIENPGLADEPMNRPHVRFDGETLEELPEKWSHAQNDALGYFLWLYCKLAVAGQIAPAAEDWKLLELFPRYFQAVRFWQDEDSGHWEESRKISASSIGTVVAGLEGLRRLMDMPGAAKARAGQSAVTTAFVDRLVEKGREALFAILPQECVQEEPSKRRAYDAALLFLVTPLEVVSGEMAARIVQNVVLHLQGEFGVRRYLGDSFWCADYKELQPASSRTADFSADMSGRDALLKAGEEAQWCIFDPILSAYYGKLYQQSGQERFRDRQTYHFNRALEQLTGPDGQFAEYLCPELYYLERGDYVPNDVTPLLWSQANLSLAFDQMVVSAKHPIRPLGHLP